jgi:hypothetical protein
MRSRVVHPPEPNQSVRPIHPAVGLRALWALAYVVLAALFLMQVARLHDARTGFTPLVIFGDYFAPVRLTRLRDARVYTYRNTVGYDGQFYAQIAVAGNPFDPELSTALDAPAYRTGRILLPVLAHLAGLGRPAWVLRAYALLNVVCWLILAWAAARWWFPPTGFDNFVRWTGTMFGAGMMVSVTRSLTDGPALLFIAVGIRCIEQNRRTLAAAILGAAGLVREMSILAASVFVPPIPSEKNAWRRAVLAAAVILPAVLWAGILSMHYGISKGGIGTFGIPVTAFVGECRNLGSMVRRGNWLVARDDVYVTVAVFTQVAFVLGRPQPALPWWRIGAVFAVVALLLGHLAWEDPECAVARQVLPLALAFNVVVPRTRRGLALLLAGNLTVLSASRTLDAGPREQTAFALGVTMDYASNWYDVEHSSTRTWRWSSGSAVLSFHNPTTRALRVNLDFDIDARTATKMTFHVRNTYQVLALQAQHGVSIHFGPFDLPPGDTPFALDTSEPPWTEPGAHGRALAFSVQHVLLTEASAP